MGGTPPTKEALRCDHAQPPSELRVVSIRENEANLRDPLDQCGRNSLIVVRAPTPLPHKVSAHYTRPQCDVHQMPSHSRGLEDLAHAVTRGHLHAARGSRLTRP